MKGHRVGFVVLGLGLLLFPASLSQAKDKTKEEVVADLASADESKVYDAMQYVEKHFPDDAALREKVASHLADARPKLKRKSARVLGALGAKLTKDRLREVQSLLSAPDKDSVIDGLKALRGLANRDDFGPILPLLQSPDQNVKRDSCRTLAVIANKSAIPKIEPLLNDPEKKVRDDAEAAIAALKGK